MKWFILVMLLQPVDGNDAYVFSKPAFESNQACVEYVKTNAPQLNAFMRQDIGQAPVDSVYCAREDSLRKIIQPQKQGITT